MSMLKLSDAASIIRERVLANRANDPLDVSECEPVQGERAGLGLLIVMDEVIDGWRGR